MLNSMTVPAAFVLAAPHSGSGKTTIASLLCLALRERGLRVQPFKLGPDYLDPTHLSRAACCEARNLDTFLLPEERVKELYARAAKGADVCVIEGLMGLYDGRDPENDEYSTAHLARLLGLPVVLVIDASGTSRTVAAVVRGLAEYGAEFGKKVRVAGVILNRVGSERHAQLCEQALAQINIPVLGFVIKDTELQLPARHLGLVSAELARWDEEKALAAARHLRLDELLRLGGETFLSSFVPAAPNPHVTIAYALDEAFHFYYPDALEELRLAGARLVSFSPLRDSALPKAHALLLGGGYPEAHAAELSANTSMREAVQAFAESGRPVVGECGGLMYLGETLTDVTGNVHEMAGVIPYHTRLSPRPLLGYREATALSDSPLLRAGKVVRGHEFHYSVLEHEPNHPAYEWQVAGQVIREGYARGNVLGSYLHLHYGGFPEVARSFVAAAEAFL